MPSRRSSKKDSPKKLAGRMKRRWRVVLLRSKGEILGTVEAPGVTAAKGGPLLQIRKPLYPSIPVLNASRFPLPGESRQSRSGSAIRNADEHAPRQCRKRQGAIAAIVVALLRLARVS
jgi:hypothetical protein